MCAIEWPQPLSCCPCGYAPESLELFVTQLGMRRRRGVLQIAVGGALLALMIPAWLAFRDFAGAAMLAIMFGSGMTIGGLTIASRGMLQVGRATRHLQTVKELRRLPEARLHR